MAFFDKLNDRIPVIRLCDLKIRRNKKRPSKHVRRSLDFKE